MDSPLSHTNREQYIRLAEVLEVMNEVRQPPRFIDFIASRHDAFRQRTRSTAKYSYFANLQINNIIQHMISIFLKNNINNIIAEQIAQRTFNSLSSSNVPWASERRASVFLIKTNMNAHSCVSFEQISKTTSCPADQSDWWPSIRWIYSSSIASESDSHICTTYVKQNVINN